jgi:hypothetical protein
MFASSPALMQHNHRIGVCNQGLLVVVLACVGCNSGQPFDYVPISGRITYEDGTTLPIDGTLRLTFYSDAPPVDGKYHPRPGSAFPDQNGDFADAMTMRPGDGLTSGTHRVTVGYMGRSATGIVPDECTLKNKTPIVVDTSQQPFEIKIPRP